MSHYDGKRPSRTETGACPLDDAGQAVAVGDVAGQVVTG